MESEDLPGPSGLNREGRSTVGVMQVATNSEAASLQVASQIAVLCSSLDSNSGTSTPQSTLNRNRPTENSSGTRRRRTTTDFPFWMRITQPLRFPYVAQLGDEVVYFRQGHFVIISC